MLALTGMMHFANQSRVLVLMRLPLSGGESGHPHVLGILPDLNVGLSLTLHAY